MNDLLKAHIIHNEISLRIGFFIGIFLLLFLAEAFFPRRLKNPEAPQKIRKISNLLIVIFNNLLMRLLLPLLAIDMAFIAEKNQWGIFNQYEIPFWWNFGLTIVFLDFVIYLQHVMFHAIPIFWRIHRMHHADVDVDVTTGVRFHPFEVVLSMIIKIGAVVIVGASPLGVLAFEILLNASSMFTHTNLNIPLPVDRSLRLGIVTPDMHRIHHSIKENETNSNFGFNFSVWDRLCGTYRSQPSDSQETMTLGITDFRAPKYSRLDWLLLIPFLGIITHYTLNHQKRNNKDKENDR